MWGSDLGISLFKKGFSNYNGRYAGNLIVMFLTRSRLLRMIIMTLTILGIIYLCSKIVNKEKKVLFYIGFMLFLTIPTAVFTQAVVWTSGFTNYAISVVLTLIYIYLNKDIIVKNNENKKTKYSILIFLLAFISSLFIENLTIYNVILGITLILYSNKKYKKVSNFNISYLIGSILGSVLMFSNGAYQNVLNGSDNYRAISKGIFGILEKYFIVIYKELIFNNLLLNIIITILLVVLTYRFINKNKDKKIKDILLFSIIINVSYTIYTLMVTINQSWFILLNYTKYFEGIFTILYFLSIVTITIITISNKNKKMKLLFYLSSIILMVLPLFFVSPVGSRCFFATYIMFIMYIVELTDYLFEDKAIQLVGKVALFIIVILGIYLLNIYAYIFSIDYNRNRNVQKNSKDFEVVIVEVLPYQKHVWMPNPLPKYGLETNYKSFYNIDKHIKFYVIDFSVLNK
ncbi:MAG: DUF6056 family protein [Bacilli bacterium]|nr:DUF6056 family protein [Bacilli bacterium]